MSSEYSYGKYVILYSEQMYEQICFLFNTPQCLVFDVFLSFFYLSSYFSNFTCAVSYRNIRILYNSL